MKTKTKKRTLRNDTPRVRRESKTKAVYIRVDSGTCAWLRKLAIERGHSFAKVADEMLAFAHANYIAPVPPVAVATEGVKP